MPSETKKANADLRVKYRPRRFRHLVQGLADPVVRSITLAIEQRRKLQALLLRGPYGSGKTSIARLLGRRASCHEQHLHPFEPCGNCSGCQAVHKRPRSASWEGYSELDVQSLPPRKMIDLIFSHVCYNKQGGKITPQRVVTLDEFHRLTLRDQQKFLKIIEDFGSRFRTLFVLCITPEAKICPAIVQRCSQRIVKLPLLKVAARHVRVVARAEGVNLSPDDAELVAATALRVPRSYLAILQDVLIFNGGMRHVSRETVELACDLFVPDLGQDAA